eukprot:scaffold15125_cov111-Isochrysis_galbana.AAC.4
MHAPTTSLAHSQFSFGHAQNNKHDHTIDDSDAAISPHPPIPDHAAQPSSRRRALSVSTSTHNPPSRTLCSLWPQRHTAMPRPQATAKESADNPAGGPAQDPFVVPRAPSLPAPHPACAPALPSPSTHRAPSPRLSPPRRTPSTGRTHRPG